MFTPSSYTLDLIFVMEIVKMYELAENKNTILLFIIVKVYMQIQARRMSNKPLWLKIISLFCIYFNMLG